MSPWANYFAAPNLEEQQHVQSGFETFQQLRIPNFQSKSMKTKNIRELHQITMCVNVKNNYFIHVCLVSNFYPYAHMILLTIFPG